jgi:hypothetical protein
MWGEDAQADYLPRSRDAKRALPDAWRDEYRAENGGWPEAESARAMEARGVFAGSSRLTCAGAQQSGAVPDTRGPRKRTWALVGEIATREGDLEDGDAIARAFAHWGGLEDGLKCGAYPIPY